MNEGWAVGFAAVTTLSLGMIFEVLRGIRTAVRRLVELGEAQERLEHSQFAQRMTEQTLANWRKTR